MFITLSKDFSFPSHFLGRITSWFGVIVHWTHFICDIVPQWFKMIGSDDAVESHQMKSLVTIDSQSFLFLHHGSIVYSGSGSIVSRLSLPDATEQDAGVYVCVQPGSSNPIRNSFHVIVLPPISASNISLE